MTKKLPVGVHHSKGGNFRSIITVSKKQYHLGTFADIETAAKVRVQAKKMTDELIERLGKTEFVEVPVEVRVPKYIEVPVPEFIYVDRPSIWRRLLKSIGVGV